MDSFVSFMQANWQWLSGCAALVFGAGTYIYLRIRALQLGVQALLRAQMIQYYNHYRDKGYAPLYARESFENCWVQYEKLGRNGVMLDIRSKFLQLPTHDDN